MTPPRPMSRRDLAKLTVGAMTGLCAGCIEFSPAGAQSPDGNLAEAKNAFLKQELFLDRPSLGRVTDIRVEPESVRIGIAGVQEAVRVSMEAAVEASVPFPRGMTQVKFLDSKGDFKAGFLDTGGVGWQDASLLDSEGRRRWAYGSFTYPEQEAVNHTVATDFEGDGAMDFIVGCNGGGGVIRLDNAGKVVWRQADSNVWHVEVTDTDGDGTPEIIHSSSGGQLTLRDPTGKVIKKSQPVGHVSDFSLCRWPDRESELRLLIPSEDQLRLLDLDCQEMAAFDAPGCPKHGRAIGTGVRFGADAEHLAVLTTDDRTESRLFVYDSDGKVVHQERLNGGGFALATLLQDGTESLLVGGSGNVWKYRLAR